MLLQVKGQFPYPVNKLYVPVTGQILFQRNFDLTYVDFQLPLLSSPNS